MIQLEIPLETLEQVQVSAEREARVLSREFVRAAERDREAILAALEFEQWLAESCDDLAAIGRTQQ